jgi:hypothetical protein
MTVAVGNGMKPEPEPCVVCGSSAEVHVDERRNRHITCPTCGGYIAAEAFAIQYQKLEPAVQQDFAAWMISTKHKPDRYLHKTRPLKNNPYSSAEGFEMVSISRIQAGNFSLEHAKKSPE